jgi:hypothetical protein
MRRVNARFKQGPVDSGEESIALTTLLEPLELFTTDVIFLTTGDI